ncbi:hypothetical protein TTHERM_00390100 (macronuclear) [Tetrahymena thermophila SB210]|uniref:Uncharacterized protein n=1 Tax=Tetrahymena thermophila (strain SB210) TaxID=312017 RepID=Q23R78_TETTS|nr:hypothetical protein TTHERM_00390100 [Tetrahymena thermophila SB210]EAR99170.2 hypothetical protein TTHERM_00390100 [Tetrahymena thermophila SB210]|eukprot:XP_001019415.2 hypothetical protein TTHERM_00390100 [Tetrahymena thermophila SB210]
MSKMKLVQTGYCNWQAKNSLQNDANRESNDEQQQIIPVQTAQFQIPLIQNINQYEKFMLYYDAPFDIRYFTNHVFYDEEYQRKYKPILGIKEYINDKIGILEVDSIFQQVRDPSHIIKQLMSLSSQEAYDMAKQIEKNYLNFQKLLRTADKLDSKGINHTFDREKLYQKVIQATKKIVRNGSKIVLINVLSMDMESMEMKKIAVGGTYELGNVILSKRNQLLSSLMKLGSFNYGGDMKIFTKHQFPDCDNKDISVYIHTLDGFILPCISRLHTVPLDDQNFNILLAKQFIIDPLLLEKLKDIRKKMKDHGIDSMLTEDKYGEKRSFKEDQSSVISYDFDFLKNRNTQSFNKNNEDYIKNASQNYLERPLQQQHQGAINSLIFQNQEKFISMSEYENSSSEDNTLMFKEDDEAAMCFEPPQFEVSTTEKLISTEMMLNQEKILRQQQIQIQQNVNNTQRYQNILNQQKVEALKFINRFYSPQIK